MASSSPSDTATATSTVVATTATKEKEEENKTATSSSSSSTNVNNDTTTAANIATADANATTTKSNVTTTTTTRKRTTANGELKLPYHERQSRANQLCLVHAINMIVGSKIVSKSKLDQVCNDLVSADPERSSSWLNPHRSIWGTGNYDVNVAMVALQQLGYETKFFDKRKPITELPLINKEDEQQQRQDSSSSQSQSSKESSNEVQGFLVNIQGTPGTWKNLWHFPFVAFGSGGDSRHWLVIKQFHKIWFLLDSKLDGPKRIDDIIKSLQSLILDKKKDNHIIIVEKRKLNNEEVKE